MSFSFYALGSSKTTRVFHGRRISTIKLTPVSALKAVSLKCFVKAGACDDHALSVTTSLMDADCRGTFSHGMQRLPLYIRDLETGKVGGRGQPEVISETVSTAWVDGNNLLGAVVGEYCMHMAVRKARETGVGWVVAKRSNHFGSAGYYSRIAEGSDMIGLAYSNASPGVLATKGKHAVVGTNPIAASAPAGEEGEGFALDMATSVVAEGQVDRAKGVGAKIPDGWAVDEQLQPTTDPYKVAFMAPLGTQESTASYKGYGLALLVDILSGVLSDARYGKNMKQWLIGDVDEDYNISMGFVALDPAVFAPGFEGRIKDLHEMCRNSGEGVMIPGDRARLSLKKVAELGSIPYPSWIADIICQQVEQLGFQKLEVKEIESLDRVF